MKTVVDPGRLSGLPVCLFVSYSADGSVKRHVAYHLDAIKACGFKTILILVVDRIVNRNWKRLVAQDQALVVRKNAGFDFGAWADAFRVFPELWRADCVLLVNDSIFGPLGSLLPVMRRALALPADLVSLTQSFERRRHLQSYFLIMKRRALASAAVQQFWSGIKNLPTKREVIEAYEITLLDYCLANGVLGNAVFELDDYRQVLANPTINLWNILLERGFPYLKVELFRTLIDKRIWRQLQPIIANPALVEIISEYISRNAALHAADAPEANVEYEGARRKLIIATD